MLLLFCQRVQYWGLESNTVDIVLFSMNLIADIFHFSHKLFSNNYEHSEQMVFVQ